MYSTSSSPGQAQIVGHHRRVADVLEHAADVAVDVAHAEVGVRERLVLEAGDELVLVGQLGVGIDQVGAAAPARCSAGSRRPATRATPFGIGWVRPASK